MGKRVLSKGMLLVIGAFAVLAVVSWILFKGKDERRSLLNRPEPGSGSVVSKMNVETADGTITGTIDVVVSERMLTGGDLESEFGKVEELLGGIIFSEGDSFDHVTKDLYLPDRLDGSPVLIRWSSDRQELVNLSGKVLNEELTGAVGMNLTAHLEYMEETREIAFPIVVAPRPRSESEEFLAALTADMRRLDAETPGLGEVVLPTRFRDREIIWKTPSDNPAPLILMIGVVLCIFMFVVDRRKKKEALARRDEQLMCDYPELVDKLSLLVGAGMTIRGAWQRICGDYSSKRAASPKAGERFCFEEMLVTEHELENGVAEGRAYDEFGQRCGLPAYRKLGQLLARNIKRGSRTMIPLLETESRDAFAKRKNFAREQGEKAGTKLLLPMGGMLVLIMAIVVYPAMQSF